MSKKSTLPNADAEVAKLLPGSAQAAPKLVSLADAAAAAQPAPTAGEPPVEERLVDGIPVRTYRGTSLSELAPQISAELGDSAMILRQREGVTGGVGGFFAKRCVEVDVALIDVPGAASTARIDVSDGPSVGPEAPHAGGDEERQNDDGEDEPTRAPAAGADADEESVTPAPFSVGLPSAKQAADFSQALAAEQRAHAEQTGSGAKVTVAAAAVKSAKAAKAEAKAHAKAQAEAEAKAEAAEAKAQAKAAAKAEAKAAKKAARKQAKADAALIDGRFVPPVPTSAGPAAPALVPSAFGQAGDLAGPLRRGFPESLGLGILQDARIHGGALQPERSLTELLTAELARRIPTAPLSAGAGQVVAFVGSSGAGKTRALARVAALYAAAGELPVACVTLQGAGDDGLLATALAPFGVAVHAAPDLPHALDRITALRAHSLVLVDTPGVSPRDGLAIDQLAATLRLLELDEVALCLPVMFAAPIAQSVIRSMRALQPSVLVATHADEADLIGAIAAVAIDSGLPIAYVSGGAGRGAIVGADSTRIAAELVGTAAPAAVSYPAAAVGIHG